MDDVARFLNLHVPWCELPLTGTEYLAANLEVLYLPAGSDPRKQVAPGGGGVLVLRSGTIRCESPGSPRVRLFGEGDFLLESRPPLGDPSAALHSEEDCLIYRIPPDVLAPWARHPSLQSWLQGDRTDRLSLETSATPDSRTRILADALRALEEAPPGAVSPPPSSPLDLSESLRPPAAALLYFWHRLSEVRNPEALAIWVDAAVATLFGHCPEVLNPSSRGILLARVFDAALRKALFLAGSDLLPRIPWALWTNVPEDGGFPQVPIEPRVLLAASAGEEDRRQGEHLLEVLDRVLHPWTSGKERVPSREWRCLLESEAVRITSGSLDLMVNWLDGHPVAGSLDSRPFRRDLLDALRPSDHAHRLALRIRLALPVGLVRGLLVLADGRRVEAGSVTDLVHAPLVDLARLAAIRSGLDAVPVPDRLFGAARAGLLPEPLARAAVGSWHWVLAREMERGRPEERSPFAPGVPPVHFRDLSPRNRHLLQDVLEVLGQVLDALDPTLGEDAWRF